MVVIDLEQFECRGVEKGLLCHLRRKRDKHFQVDWEGPTCIY